MNGSDMNYHEAGAPQAPGQVPGKGAYAAGGWDRPRRSPVLATFLSLMPGLGQVYLGYYQQGFINLAVIATCITALASERMRGIEPFIGLSMAFYWLYNMVDANRRAHHFNRVAAGLGAEQLPDEFPMPKPRGSTFTGAILIAVGVLFLLDLNFDVPLDWLADWWPAVLVLIGARMIWQSRKRGA